MGRGSAILQEESVMRLAAALLASLGVGALSGALADPPSSPQEQSAAAEPAAATTTTSTTEAATAKAAVTAPQTAPAAPTTASADPEEKRLRAMGYKMQMRNGEKVFCRREQVIGSRLEGKLICGTVQDLAASADQARQNVEHAQHQEGTTRNPGQ
jgi:hypothetical protein